MNQATIDLLKSCAKDLKEIRVRLPSNLEPSVSALFESVVKRLEQSELLMTHHAALLALIDDGLKLVCRFGEAVMVVVEVVNRCRS
jgi:hypothetical protein